MRAVISKNKVSIYTIFKTVNLEIVDSTTLRFLNVYTNKTVSSDKGILGCLDLVDILLTPPNSCHADTYSQYERRHYNSLEDTVEIDINILKKIA